MCCVLESSNPLIEAGLCWAGFSPGSSECPKHQLRSEIQMTVHLKFSPSDDEVVLGLLATIPPLPPNTRVGTLIVATIYLQLIQNRYILMFFFDVLI